MKEFTNFPATSGMKGWTDAQSRVHVMEIYVAYKDYRWMMEFTEQMLEHIALKVLGTHESTVGDHEIDFKAPYRRVTMIDAIKEHTAST